MFYESAAGLARPEQGPNLPTLIALQVSAALLNPMPLSRSLQKAPRFWGRLGALALGAGLLTTGLARPAPALETVTLKLPMLQTTFTLRLSELTSPAALMAGRSDLAELDRASNGALGRSLVGLFQQPLPLQNTAVLDESMAQPLVQQVLLMLSTFGSIDNLGAEELSPGKSSKVLAQTLHQLFAKGQPSLLALLQALPGKGVTIDVQEGLKVAERLTAQQRRAQQLMGGQPAASVDPSLDKPGPLAVQRQELVLAVGHRPQPLQLVVIQPTQGANGKLVVISHGLWDSPENFEGWAKHLASYGYTVILPRHPGSDSSQQQAMLSGKVLPPGPAELRLRPLDVSASLDAVQARSLKGLEAISAAQVVVIGHSWGATTALQLAGAIPSATELRSRCQIIDDPERNLSWVLQCSFLSAADRAAAPDQRVVAIAAVSPPSRLLFAPGSAAGMTARGLLISGSRDWVVPPDPEAITPFGPNGRFGHTLVLANGGDHFNLRAPAAGNGSPLRGLLLAWVQAAFSPGASLKPAQGLPPLLPASGWGNGAIPLVNVTSQLTPAGN